MARQMPYKLTEENIVVISGLVKGIDTAEHSIIDKEYPTIAVMASGINIVYPKSNQALYTQIIENSGVIVNKMPFNSPPKATFLLGDTELFLVYHIIK